MRVLLKDEKCVVRTEVHNSVNDLFQKLNNHFNNEHGDISPENAIKLDGVMDDLSDCLIDYLRMNLS